MLIFDQIHAAVFPEPPRFGYDVDKLAVIFAWMYHINIDVDPELIAPKTVSKSRPCLSGIATKDNLFDTGKSIPANAITSFSTAQFPAAFAIQ
jgi:hypothetical protein